MRLSTTFDSPQFPLLPDAQGARHYANVDNRVDYMLGYPVGQSFPRPVAVPTGLFTLMKQVFKIEPHEQVTMYLHEYQPDRFVFGIDWGDGDHDFADLWTYTWETLPGMFKEFDG